LECAGSVFLWGVPVMVNEVDPLATVVVFAEVSIVTVVVVELFTIVYTWAVEPLAVTVTVAFLAHRFRLP